MLRIATLAAVAAVLGAAPASAESIRVSTAGKTPAQVKAEVTDAAVKVCRATGDATLAYYVERSCVRHAVKTALGQSPDAPRMASIQQ